MIALAMAGCASAPPRPSIESGLEHEARTALRALWMAEKSYFQEHDRYSADFTAIGFAPSDACVDATGAKQRIPLAGATRTCHFTLTTELSGVAFVARATGDVAPAIGLVFALDASGAVHQAAVDSPP